MRASAIEYRFRFLLHGILYMAGLWPFWEPWFGFTTKSTWLTLSSWLARQGWLSFQASTMVLLAVAILFASIGAALRVWGSAYVGSGVVNSGQMHGERLLADGPYRRTRNPLYLGTLIHTFGLALLMPPAGALLCIAGIWILQVRLALAEEPYLQKLFGSAYIAYRDTVPRFLPSLRPLIPSAGQKPQWLQAFAGEIYMVGVALTLLLFGWNFNALPLIKGIVISFGISLVLRALMPRAGAPTPRSSNA